MPINMIDIDHYKNVYLLFQLLYCIKYHDEPKNLAKELENVMPPLTNMFRFLLQQNNCAVIRTTVLEVSLALTKQGLLCAGLGLPKPQSDNIWITQEEKMLTQFQLEQQIDDVTDDIPRSLDAREAFFKAMAKKRPALKWTEDKWLAFLSEARDYPGHSGSLSALITMLLEHQPSQSPFSEKAARALLAFVIALLESGKVMNERVRGLLIHYSGALLANHSCRVKESEVGVKIGTCTKMQPRLNRGCGGRHLANNYLQHESRKKD